MKNFAFLLLLIATSGHAYSIASYKETVEKFDKTRDELLSMSLGAYHIGIAEALQTLQKYQGGKIFYEGKPFIRIPESATVDNFMVESIMRNQLRNLEPYRKLFGEEHADYAAFQLAFTGLWRTFPCTEP